MSEFQHRPGDRHEERPGSQYGSQPGSQYGSQPGSRYGHQHGDRRDSHTGDRHGNGYDGRTGDRHGNGYDDRAGDRQGSSYDNPYGDPYDDPYGAGYDDRSGAGGNGYENPPDRGGSPGGGVHQVFFRWDASRGPQGSGMAAVAHSCGPERATELAGELGPLLWVPGVRRASVVRVPSHRGDILLVQRRPFTDRTGRPSTLSHAFVGDRHSLPPELCLALAYQGWGSPQGAEEAAGELRVVERERLRRLAEGRLPEMVRRLPEVARPLTLIAAEWLRDPRRRVSLLAQGPPDDRGDTAALVGFGLFRLFADWLNQEWSFATYDAVDTHPVRLVSVPRWEPDAGGAGQLARVEDQPLTKAGLEHHVADLLVRQLLANPAAGPGVPQLTGRLRGGAALDWPDRRELLRGLLEAERHAVARRPASARRPDPVSAPPTHGAPSRASGPDRAPGPDRASGPAREPGPEPAASAPAPPAWSRESSAPARPVPEWPTGRSDEELVAELGAGQLSPNAVQRALAELRKPDRRETRTPELRHRLCREVVQRELCLPPPGEPGESATGRARRAADLFAWAVVPLARDETHLEDLHKLLHRILRKYRSGDPAAAAWLQEALLRSPDGNAPQLHPALWQQLVRELLDRTDESPRTPPRAAPADRRPAPAPTQDAYAYPDPEPYPAHDPYPGHDRDPSAPRGPAREQGREPYRSGERPPERKWLRAVEGRWRGDPSRPPDQRPRPGDRLGYAVVGVTVGLIVALLITIIVLVM
ncbi:hypothetical protein NX801_06505 [Streptomyces sp. LP05-1]|uniref:Uncharacterized protein n=1 Tax=Streptomyces pyxinae TaxID=2970734 RepID=A0ABT2CD29_9ACTN|nr:hypothetical protein [Streptomyces sp. LP05-1]MCS0635313.1 hypothetical protein [Streptomyces sp. LP05-1]